MRGIPKVFGTVQDVENCLALAPQATKARLQELLETRFAWFSVRRLEEGEAGLEDETHKIISKPGETGEEGPEERPEERWQYELQEDPHAALFRIGLTAEMVNHYLTPEA